MTLTSDQAEAAIDGTLAKGAADGIQATAAAKKKVDGCTMDELVATDVEATFS